MRYIFVALWLLGCLVDFVLVCWTVVFLVFEGGDDGYLVETALLASSVLLTGTLWSLAGKVFPDRWPNR